jgi:geranylgeranyl pyrophosphate synthase
MAKREINDPWITDSLYSNMIRKKSAELIGVACELGAVVAKSSKEIQKELYEFGINLGLAYQAYDDYAGIWKAENETGKVSYKDIIEKKKSMPVIYAMSKLPDPLAKELKELYDGDRIETIDKVVGLLEQAGAKEYCKTQGLAYKQKALSNLEVVLDTPVFREYKAITDYLIKF